MLSCRHQSQSNLLILASPKCLIRPVKRVTREGRSSIHVDQECFKCSLLEGKLLGGVRKAFRGRQALRLAPLGEM